MLLIRSRKQHPFRTCKLSVDVPHLRVHVQGCPWSSAAVDVPTDVDQGGSSAPRFARPPGCCQTSDSGSGAFRPGSSRGGRIADDLARWGCVASRRPGASPTTRQPGGSPEHNRCVHLLALPPGCRVVALQGGRGDATPCPTPRSRSSTRERPSRRPACPARARST
jgi:hypothetical protein